MKKLVSFLAIFFLIGSSTTYAATVTENGKNKDPQTAQNFVIGDDIVGSVANYDDVDVYKFNVTKPNTFWAESDFKEGTKYSTNYGLAVFDKTGNLLAVSDTYIDEENIPFESVEKYLPVGTYYLVVEKIDEDKSTIEGKYDITTGIADLTPPPAPIVDGKMVTNKAKSFTGKAEANSAITVKVGTKVIATAKTNASGVFTVTMPLQKEGTVLSITATDAAKNTSKITKITVRDVIAPGSPVVNPIKYTSTSVTGKAEAKSTVTVKVGSKILGSGKADAKGMFKITIKKQKKGTTLSITATDAAKNSSKTSIVKVK
ncbi:hypothetical protein J5Y03_08115 [Bacillus sp. RG28]|uniref:Bacterial Ig domain-containing protein n=1 Tax=Gottfriedia endophytica TaxID=2820819 RepID=A0A940NQR9_9BACI|nr:Ig-like domain-containing protein [Gottfriedia endophytica]MBP0725156.1 hypothetical protein [Gottfriedia endophytica]